MTKKPKKEDQDQSDNVLSSDKRDADKAKEFWTKEEMEKAKPIPFPKTRKKTNEKGNPPEASDDE